MYAIRSYYEFLGDVTDNGGVIKSGDNAGLQRLGNIRPWHNGKFQTPRFIRVGVDRGFSYTEVDGLVV